MREKRLVGRALLIVTLALGALGAVPTAASAAAGWYFRPNAAVQGVGYVYLSSVGNRPGLQRAQPNITLWLIRDHITGFQIRTYGGPSNSCLTDVSPPNGGLFFGVCRPKGQRAPWAQWEFHAVLGGGRTLKRPPAAGNSYQIRNLLAVEKGGASCLGVVSVLPGTPAGLRPCGSPGTTWRLGYLSYP